MQAPEYYRYRIHFEKSGPLVWSGHLDLQTCWERILRRAEVPVAYSNGFHRRPKFVFSATLPLGMIGCNESLDLWCDNPLHPERTIAAINKTAPDGLIIKSISVMESNAKKPTHGIIAAEYEAIVPVDTIIPDADCLADQSIDTLSTTTTVDTPDIKQGIKARLSSFKTHLEGKIRELMDKTDIEKVKGSKSKKRYNLRPLVESLSISEAGTSTENASEDCNIQHQAEQCKASLNRSLTLHMRLSLKEGATGRPDAVLEELGLDPHHVTVSRTSIIRASPATTTDKKQKAALGR